MDAAIESHVHFALFSKNKIIGYTIIALVVGLTGSYVTETGQISLTSLITDYTKDKSCARVHRKVLRTRFPVTAFTSNIS